METTIKQQKKQHWFKWFIGKIVLLFNMGIVSAFLLGFLAAYIDPRQFWLPQFFGLGMYYLSWLVVGSLIVWILKRKKKGILIHLFLVIMIVGRIVSLGYGQKSNVKDDEGFTILSLNLPEKQSGGLVDFVDKLAPDLIGLQECFAWRTENEPLWDGTDYITPIYSELGYTPMLTSKVGWDGSIGAPVFSKGMKTTDATSYKLRYPGSRRTFAIRTEVTWNNKKFVYYNVHLASYGVGTIHPWKNLSRIFELNYWRSAIKLYRDAFQNRANEAEILATQIRKESLPVLVAGDFNTTMHNWAFQQLAVGMRDAMLVGGAGMGGTYHEKYPLFRIDHVLVGKDWEIGDATIHTETLSDHRAISVKLQLSSP